MEVINMFFKRKQQQNSNNEEHSSPRTNDYSEQKYQYQHDDNDWDFSKNYHQVREDENQTLYDDSLSQNHYYQIIMMRSVHGQSLYGTR